MADVRGQTCRWTTIGGVIAMQGRKVGIEIGAKIVPSTGLRVKGMGKRLSDQVVLRAKMAIETTVSEACSLHNFGDSDRLKTLLAEEPAGCIQDPATIFRHLLSTDSHFEILRRHH